MSSAFFDASDAGNAAFAGALAAYEEALRTILQRVHPSWLRALGIPAQLPQSRQAQRHWRNALACTLDVHLPHASALTEPAHLIAILPHESALRVLRARAALRRRRALRQCLDSVTRRRLSAWLGAAVFEAIICEADDTLDGPAALPLDVASLDLAACATPDTLAWEGFCLFERDALWRDMHLTRLLRISFPCNAASPLPGKRERVPERCGGPWVVARLSRFVPEVPWLSGCVTPTSTSV